MSKILIVLTGADHWTLKDGTRHPTGFWAEEFVVPHRHFREAGHQVDLATPGGVTPTVDQGSLAPKATGGEDASARLRAYLEEVGPRLDSPLSLEDISAAHYDAIFLPGGHGPMEDLPHSAALGRILIEALDSGRRIAALCHGPAGLISAVRPDGSWAFAGRAMTAFTDEEERSVGFADKAPWLLESRLRELGANLEIAPPWSSHAIVDGNLITGQNPQSSARAAEDLLRALSDV